jgi:hypothetical protein
MLLQVGGPRRLDPGVGGPRVVFGPEVEVAASGARGRRLLLLDERPAFELAYWCGTCPILFERLEGASTTLSLEELAALLGDGVRGLDETVMEAFGRLLPAGTYVPLLLQVTPRLVLPMHEGDYFSEEQVTTWGIDPTGDLPLNPKTPYYRTFETRIDQGAHLFEFVVPMVPPSWNDEQRVAAHAVRLTESAAPTAVAVTVLDVAQPLDDDESSDDYEHWALVHFLLDGHHKMQAAAALGRPLQLLSLLSTAASHASPEDLARLPDLRARPPAAPPPGPGGS